MRNYIKKVLFLFGIALGVLYSSSCENEVYQVINISENKKELVSVLDHYRHDKTKFEAAKFLILNMEGKRTIYNEDTVYISNILDIAENTIDSSGWSPNLSVLNDRLRNFKINHDKDICKLDCNYITAAMLIANIDSAFSQWRRVPWSNEYSFSQFCEYVLPYRIFDEILINWREIALSRDILDVNEMSLDTDVFDVAVSLYDSFEIKYNYGMGRYRYSMNIDEVNKIKKGNCIHVAAALAFYFRAYGIPSAIDCTPAWGNRSSSHIWNAIIYPDGRSVPTTYHPEGINEIYYKLPKIYRRSYKKIKNELSAERAEDIPPFFKGLNMLDVTDKYNLPTSDVTLTNLSPGGAKVVYLSVFNNNEWVAVAHAPINGSKAVFNNVGVGLPIDGQGNKLIEYIDQGDGIVYLPTYYINGRTIIAGDPFILSKKGGLIPFNPNLSCFETIKLQRKYPMNPEFKYAEKRLIGGVFEASNDSLFFIKDTLATIDEVATKHCFNIFDKKKYRYIRFTPKECLKDTIGIQIAEISYYNNNNTKLMCTSLSLDAKYLYDDDVLTYFWLSAKESYEKLSCKFADKQPISKIEIYAMNDDNGINLNQHYEVYYWNKGWKLINKLEAEDTILTIRNVPKGALLYIRNVDKGVEQRIFTYDNHKQIWW